MGVEGHQGETVLQSAVEGKNEDPKARVTLGD